jgi:hypothetical protein
MPDLDPEIWNNRTLGEVTTNENLERLTRQQLEDRSAQIEGREPRLVVVENTYPDWTAPTNDRTGTVPSNYTPVRFEDERPNDVVQADNGIKPEGMSDEEWNAGQTDSGETVEGGNENPDETELSQDEAPSESETVVSDESEPTQLDSTEESDSTKWQS